MALRTEERTFRLTQFGINALDRRLPVGVQDRIMQDLFDVGSLTSSDIVDSYPNIPPETLRRMVDDLISRDWIVAL